MQIDISPPESRKKYGKIVKDVISAFLAKHQINSNANVGIHFVSAAKIKDINQKFRKIDRVTDVLSFPIWKNQEAIPKVGKVNLGDIFICEAQLQEDLIYIIKHALNHLIGKHH